MLTPSLCLMFPGNQYTYIYIYIYIYIYMYIVIHRQTCVEYILLLHNTLKIPLTNVVRLLAERSET